MHAKKRKLDNASDIIQAKKARLEELQEESDFAIKMVSDTIGNLEAVNADIAQTVAEIDTYVNSLNATRDGLSQTSERNARIMQNFKQLLCVG